MTFLLAFSYRLQEVITCDILGIHMQIFAFMHRSEEKKLAERNKKAAKMSLKAGDSYQDSLNILGKEQFKKMLEKGLQMPIALL